MAVPPMRARIAPAAFFIAFAFVVAGFVQSDREMTDAQEERAALIASEAATLVEVFLLRHASQLHIAERVLDNASTTVSTTQDSVPALWKKIPELSAHFDALAVTDSAFTVIESAVLRDGGVAPI